MSVGKVDEAARIVGDMVQEPRLASVEGKSDQRIWLQICEAMSRNAKKMESVDVEAIIKQGLKQFKDYYTGQVWCYLAIVAFSIAPVTFTKKR